MTSAPFLFRAVWPLVDETVQFRQIVIEAQAELPRVAYHARAEVIGAGRWTVVRSSKVPGFGNTTERLLVFEAPARQVARTGVAMSRLASKLGVPA